jgi:hypothetical protein
MKKSIFIAILIIVALLMIIGGNSGDGSGCQCNVSTAKVSDAKICDSMTEGVCEQDMPELLVSTPKIFVSCRLKYAVSNTKVKYSWMYYGETKIEIDTVIYDTGDRIGNLDLYSSLSKPANDWPKGVYEVIIQIQTDNAKPLVKQFNIK